MEGAQEDRRKVQQKHWGVITYRLASRLVNGVGLMAESILFKKIHLPTPFSSSCRRPSPSSPASLPPSVFLLKPGIHRTILARF